jgi:hypothetical protein
MSVLSFPLATSVFMDLLPVDSVTFDAPENAVSSITGGGEVLSAELAPQLWRGRVDLALLTNEGHAPLAAVADLLRRSGASFFVYDPRKIGPRADPSGTILASASPLILSVNADNRRLALKGLPPGYMLQRGDYLGFAYGTSPVRYALHRVVAADVFAAANGQTPQFEVTPVIRPGAAADQPVSLVRPVCKAKLLPGSLETGTGRPVVTTGFAFEWVQTLR